MRVLMLTWEFPPRSVGGVAAHVDGLSHAMAAAGHDVVLLTLAHPGSPADTMTRRRARAAGPHRPAVAARRRPRRPRRLGQPPPRAAVDRGSCRGAPTSSTPTTGRWPGPPTRSPRCSTPRSSPRSTAPSRGHHGGRVPPGEPSTIHAVESWLAHRADEVLANSRFMVREIVGGFELPPERTHLIPNGIDPTWWSTGEAPGTPRAARVHVGPRPVREGLPGPRPGDAPAARRACPGIRCVIGGRGSYLPGAAVADRPRGRQRHHRAARLPARRPAPRHRPPRRVRRHPVAVRAVRHRRPRGAGRRGAARRRPHRRAGRAGRRHRRRPAVRAGQRRRAGVVHRAGARATTTLADEMRKHGAELLADRYSWQAIAGATASVYAGHPSAP